jgi:hypothetical protein
MKPIITLLAIVLPGIVGCPEPAKPSTSSEPPIAEDVPSEPGSVAGRVCHTSGTTWLPDALVYTHLVDENGELFDTRTSYTDDDGRFELDKLPGHASYTVYVQHGGETLYQDKVLVGPGETVQLETPHCLDPRGWQVAVVTGHGQVEHSLEVLGLYDLTLIDGTDSDVLASFLLDTDALAGFDIIFFDSGHAEAGILYSLSDERKTSHPTHEGEHDTGAHDTGAHDTAEAVDSGDSIIADTGVPAPEGDDTGGTETGGTDTGSLDTGSLDTGEPAEEATIYDTAQILENLRAYVEKGGTIYALDWAYDVIQRTYPDAVKFIGDEAQPDAAQAGVAGLVEATIIDQSLAEILERETISINFRLAEWPVIESTSSSTSVHISADVDLSIPEGDFVLTDAPLLLSQRQGDGMLAVSAFRMGPSANSDMLAAMHYLLVSLREQAR